MDAQFVASDSLEKKDPEVKVARKQLKKRHTIARRKDSSLADVIQQVTVNLEEEHEQI